MNYTIIYIIIFIVGCYYFYKIDINPTLDLGNNGTGVTTVSTPSGSSVDLEFSGNWSNYNYPPQNMTQRLTLAIPTGYNTFSKVKWTIFTKPYYAPDHTILISSFRIYADNTPLDYGFRTILDTNSPLDSNGYIKSTGDDPLNGSVTANNINIDFTIDPLCTLNCHGTITLIV